MHSRFSSAPNRRPKILDWTIIVTPLIVVILLITSLSVFQEPINLYQWHRCE